MTTPSAEAARAMQRAAGAIAARHRGDPDGAQAMLDTFTSPSEQARAFCLLAELAFGLVCAQTGQSMDDLVQDLSLLLEHAVTDPPPN